MHKRYGWMCLVPTPSIRGPGMRPVPSYIHVCREREVLGDVSLIVTWADGVYTCVYKVATLTIVRTHVGSVNASFGVEGWSTAATNGSG